LLTWTTASDCRSHEPFGFLLKSHLENKINISVLISLQHFPTAALEEVFETATQINKELKRTESDGVFCKKYNF